MWLVIVFSIPSVLAAGPAVRFERLSIENGLPQSSAKAILQDQQGFYGSELRKALRVTMVMSLRSLKTER